MPVIENSMAILALWASFGYLIGSVSGGMIVARLMNLGNLREIGSGNIGATNVLRTGNKKAAAVTLVFDAGKGAVVVLLARAFAGEDAAQIAAFTAFLGHCFPVWLGFKGGKGVATYLGILWALAWPTGAVACLIWLVVALLTRFSSLAALVSAGAMPVLMPLLGYTNMVTLAVLLAALLYWRHWGNIQRLRAGTESKIGTKS
ncbi:glycerol-3-phosphate 1-O-acyltransferase PlsY [Yoonia litorea]|uniref:Glycerol-3-phosphate acyltransferase n=1 Tax=Yoonia litorea TaxID=1123755 RepID=A0A1I6L326_9RHOB|nr:glycerol-3-phosphate 1-O-acyltransferase PlsY [Yoonia litorea]SFR97855.1 acyl-phosphate glycerol-3-phosphate acyltransferase [Yoonia litorea]